MKALLLILALLVPGSVMAEGVLTPKANPAVSSLYDYKTSLAWQDDFTTGNASSSTIGTQGWLFTNGSASQVAPESSRPGIIRRDTSAASGTNTVLYTFGSTRSFLASENFAITWVVRLNTNDANTQVRLGSQNDLSNPSTSGVYFEKLDGDTNWFCVTRSASTETRADSGVAVSTSFASFALSKTGAGVIWEINGAQVCGRMTTNVPTAAQLVFQGIVNSASASKTIDTDYVEFSMTGLTR